MDRHTCGECSIRTADMNSSVRSLPDILYVVTVELLRASLLSMMVCVGLEEFEVDDPANLCLAPELIATTARTGCSHIECGKLKIM